MLVDVIRNVVQDGSHQSSVESCWVVLVECQQLGYFCPLSTAGEVNAVLLKVLSQLLSYYEGLRTELRQLLLAQQLLQTE